MLGGEVSPQSDLYVVGLIGLELMQGAPAYDGGPLAKARAQMKGNPSVSKEIASTDLYQVVIKRLLERKPAKRFWDASQAAETLAEVDVNARSGFWKRLITRH